MTEEEARTWVRDRWGSAALDQLHRLAIAVARENRRQNLISPTTIDTIWTRHIVDSAQIAPLADNAPGPWLDIGTGGGFPGMVIAVLEPRPIILVEPRRLRAKFLADLSIDLGLSHVSVRQQSAPLRDVKAHVISARAVASLEALFEIAVANGGRSTIGLFLRGKSGRAELDAATCRWKGVFHVEQSVTNKEAIVIKVSQLERR